MPTGLNDCLRGHSLGQASRLNGLFSLATYLHKTWTSKERHKIKHFRKLIHDQMITSAHLVLFHLEADSTDIQLGLAFEAGVISCDPPCFLGNEANYFKVPPDNQIILSS